MKILADRFRRLERSLDRERTILEGILYYVAVLYRYKLFIFMVTGMSAATAVAFSLWSLSLPPEESPLPNQYRAEATLLIEPRSNDVNAALRASLDMPSSRPSEGPRRDFGRTATRVLESRYVVDTLIDEFDIVQRYGITNDVRYNAREAIRAGTEISYDSASGALTILYRAIDPEFAKNMVSSMVDLLGQWFSEERRSANQEQRAFLERKLEEVSTRINSLEQQIEQFQRKYGVLTVEELSTSLTSTLSDLRSRLLTKEMQIRNRSASTNVEDPELQRLKRERDSLRELIRQVEEGFGGATGRVMPSINELPELAQRYRNLSSELETKRTIHSTLSRQHELVTLSMESGQVFQVLERAEVPLKKSGPSRGRLCMMVTFAAFLFAGGAALAHNALRKAAYNAVAKGQEGAPSGGRSENA